MDVKIKNGYFIINGKKQFITSGEVQYFRLAKARWRIVLQKLIQAHCNTVSTYVPWNWHEVEKGKFDFHGSTHPSRDLVSFLNLVKKNRLNLIVKIGPHIHAEFKNGGLPDYLLEEHPEIFCLDNNGRPNSTYYFYPPYTYLHPVFMDYSRQWFNAVMPVLLSCDNIILWQVDNEVSYSISYWGYLKKQAFSGDYNPFLVKNGLYQDFLRKRYKKIDSLNFQYNEKNDDFSNVHPPYKEENSRAGYFKVMDWLEFREDLPAYYLRELMEIMYKMGCRGPFGINDPLLGYSSSWGNIFHILKDRKWSVIIGYTYYQGNAQEESLAHHLTKIEYTKASKSACVANMELQSGDAYFLNHWKQDISDYRLTWKLAVGAGANIVNYYWFSDGYNFKGFEHFIPEMDFNSPVDKNGNQRSHYNTLKKINAFLRQYPDIVESEPVYDLSVGYYHPYARMTKFENHLGIKKYDIMPSGELIGSVLDLFSVCNIRFQLINLEDDLSDLIKAKRLVIPCHHFLPEKIQKRLLDFARLGGHLILFNVPREDENFNDCRVLFKTLGIKNTEAVKKPQGMFETENIRYKNELIPVYSDLEIYHFHDPDKITCDLMYKDKICGFTRPLQKGKISVLGFIPRVFMNISRKFARDYFKKNSEDKILIFERKKGNFSLYTLCNLYDNSRKVDFEKRSFIVKKRDALFIIKKGKQWKAYQL
ncbi:MAG: beta-galactosidase [Spirochaetes bacterium]|nr:beta-galactosidase [Spirochaetota bacterium]